MPQLVFLGKERVGRVTIERYQGKYIRLRWTLKGKTYSMNIGSDSRDTIKVAKAKAQLIDSDITFERFDPSLEKYGKARPVILELVQPVQGQEPKISLKELWERFVADKLPNVKAKTVQEYESLTKLLDKLGKAATYNATEVKQALLATTTSDQTRRMLLYLNACCLWGMKRKMLQENPFWGIAAEIPRKSSTNHEPDAFSEEEMEAVIVAFKTDKRASKNYRHYAPLVEFWFRTGCRPSEAIGLVWGKVSEDCTSVTFCGSYQVINGSHVWSPGSKNNKTRTITVSSKVQQLLKFLRPDTFQASTLVFPAPQEDKPINYDNFTRRAWNAVVDQIKPNTTPYNCRDTFITMQLLKGVPSAVIAKWCDTSTKMIDKNYADKLKLSQLRPID